MVWLILLFARILPLKALHIISRILGGLLYFLSSKRRNIAINNLRAAFKETKTEEEIKSIARQSCNSLFLTFLEIIKSRSLLSKHDAAKRLRDVTEELDKLFLKAKKAHDGSHGCIFVTPHIGNWEVLPYISSIVGIPLAVVVRPLDNAYLERLVYAQRSESGQMIIPKSNAMFVLQKTLLKGSSIGLLPDQSTMKGIEVNFFGRKALTTPVPAILAINYNRPVVVVACCRKPDGQYEGFVSDPIWPEKDKSEKAEIFRITEEMNKNMETIIRKYPEQYLWMHNRWKRYKHKKELLAKD
ncbi:MAG: lysophospholipid acyltransferase family protein [Nitrospirae bacterium]|nr:lysophospholipid acyltransferase family protein [Nitrospirota bacterium]